MRLFVQDVPTRLEGETSPDLFLSAASCDSFTRCEGRGCRRRTLYRVDVCFPAGCARSDRVRPVVAAPRNATLAAELRAQRDSTDWAAEDGTWCWLPGRVGGPTGFTQGGVVAGALLGTLT